MRARVLVNSTPPHNRHHNNNNISLPTAASRPPPTAAPQGLVAEFEIARAQLRPETVKSIYKSRELHVNAELAQLRAEVAAAVTVVKHESVCRCEEY